jgi:4-hydroxy-2-oxoheptanedioate aldolase
MKKTMRLNRIIELLEQGKTVIGAGFHNYGIGDAIRVSRTNYDYCMWDMEHNDFDFTTLRTCLQFMLDRRQILEQNSLQPKVTPIARITVDASEHNSWLYKLLLDAGVYGIMVPHLDTIDDLINTVQACRYGCAPGEPKGHRGLSDNAHRYWGLGPEEYTRRADIWPLNAEGELIIIPVIESVIGMENLKFILKDGGSQMIGCLTIGLGDLSVDMGYPWQMKHPEVLGAKRKFLEICREFDVPYGGAIPNSDSEIDIRAAISDGYRFIGPDFKFNLSVLTFARKLAGRDKE